MTGRLLLLALLAPLACRAAPVVAPADRFKAMREMMVREQIERRGVADPRVLEAMRTVPREEFVPDHLADHACDDGPLPIGHGQTISQPYIVAFMSEALRLTGSERALEIGTGSGYQAAVLSRLCRHVWSLEIVPELAASARERLDRLGFGNVTVAAGNGWLGWPQQAPFDAIMVTAAPEEVPPALIDQLAPGGRMIAPIGGGRQELVLVRKDDRGTLSRQPLLPVRFVPMTGRGQR